MHIIQFCRILVGIVPKEYTDNYDLRIVILSDDHCVLERLCFTLKFNRNLQSKVCKLGSGICLSFGQFFYLHMIEKGKETTTDVSYSQIITLFFCFQHSNCVPLVCKAIKLLLTDKAFHIQTFPKNKYHRYIYPETIE